MRLARTLLLISSLMALPSLAFGPLVEGGVGITLKDPAAGAAHFNPLGTNLLRAGLEVGDRFNHALVLEATQAGDTPWTSVTATDVRTFALRYTFSIDFLRKSGFTPSLGVGFSAGAYSVVTPTEGSRGLYLAAHATAGLRYTFGFGLGLKADVAWSTYGGFFGLQPSVGLSYRF